MRWFLCSLIFVQNTAVSFYVALVNAIRDATTTRVDDSILAPLRLLRMSPPCAVCSSAGRPFVLYVESPTDDADNNRNWLSEALHYAVTSCPGCARGVDLGLVVVVHVEHSSTNSKDSARGAVPAAHHDHETIVPPTVVWNKTQYCIASVVLSVGNDDADAHYITLRILREKDCWFVLDGEKSYCISNASAAELVSGRASNVPELISDHDGEAIAIDSIFYEVIGNTDGFVDFHTALAVNPSQEATHDSAADLTGMFFVPWIYYWGFLTSNTVQLIASKASPVTQRLAGGKRQRSGEAEVILKLSQGERLVIELLIHCAIRGVVITESLVQSFSPCDTTRRDLMYRELLMRVSQPFIEYDVVEKESVFSSSNGVFGAHAAASSRVAEHTVATSQNEVVIHSAEYAVLEELRAFPREIMIPLIAQYPNVLEAVRSRSDCNDDAMEGLDVNVKRYVSNLSFVASQSPSGSTVFELCLGLESRCTPSPQSQTLLFRLIEVSD